MKLTEKPMICVAISNPDIAGLARDLERAYQSGVKFAEARLDALARNDIASTKTFEVVEHNRHRMGLVLTLRSDGQNGGFSGTTEDAVSMLKAIGSMKPMLLDVEFGVAKQRKDLLDELKAMKVPVLVSHHEWESTPPRAKLVELLHEMMSLSYRANGEDSSVKRWVKIVTMAQSAEDPKRILSLYDHLSSPNEIMLIAFAMGKLGESSRLVSGMAVNAPFTFAAFENATAPGQMNFKEMEDFYKRHKEVLRLLGQTQRLG